MASIRQTFNTIKIPDSPGKAKDESRVPFAFLFLTSLFVSDLSGFTYDIVTFNHPSKEEIK
jgi:hypothetical protein